MFKSRRGQLVFSTAAYFYLYIFHSQHYPQRSGQGTGMSEALKVRVPGVSQESNDGVIAFAADSGTVNLGL